jgi:hypothetical protein
MQIFLLRHSPCHVLKAFAEAGYNQDVHHRGGDLAFVAITFGLRW